MKEFIQKIENKIKENFKVDKIKIIDNSYKHKKHKFYVPNKYHLCLEIESEYLNSLNRLQSQRLIMKILKEEMNEKIHALEIKIN